jgi:hypothetical protein
MEIIMESMLVLGEIPAALEVCKALADLKEYQSLIMSFYLDSPREIAC